MGAGPVDLGRRLRGARPAARPRPAFHCRGRPRTGTTPGGGAATSTSGSAGLVVNPGGGRPMARRSVTGRTRSWGSSTGASTGAEPCVRSDVWFPNMMWGEEALRSPGWQWFRVWGRLEPGAAPGQVAAKLKAVFADFRLARSRPVSQGRATGEDRAVGEHSACRPFCSKRTLGVADALSMAPSRGFRGGFPGPPHRRLQRRQPDAGPRGRPSARDGAAPCHRRGPGPGSSSRCSRRAAFWPSASALSEPCSAPAWLRRSSTC